MAKKAANKKQVDIEVDIDDATFLVLAKEAHKQDITFNQLANNILREQLKKEDS